MLSKARTVYATKNLSREEWLRLRREGIGGSDAAALVGLSPWGSPLSVYLDKKGLSPQKPQSEAMRQGTDLEEYVARRFVEETGKSVRRCNYILKHPEKPWMLANVDRMVVGEEAGLECKTTSAYNAAGYEEGEIPRHYYVQCQHYMAVTGLPKWYLAVLVLGVDFHVFEILKDDEDIAALEEAEERFWHEHVEPGIPPAPAGTSSDGEALAILYPHSDETVANLHGLEGTADMLVALKAQKKALEEEIERYEQTLKSAMGTAEKGILDGYRVSWRSSTRISLDAKRLKLDRPDIYEQYGKSTETRTFSIRREKK